MFAAFFYLLRQRGLDVSLNEWMTLLEGMEKGLHHSTLTGSGVFGIFQGCALYR